MNVHELILTHILKCSWMELQLGKVTPNADQKRLYQDLIGRLEQGEPLQYILGECEFMGLPFKTDPRALIPRPETELLVEMVLNQMKDSGQDSKILDGLDIGTGCGNIPISLVKHNPRMRMVTMDVSFGALALAQENAALNNVLARVDFIEADVLTWLNSANTYHKYFSFIVSNPPYIKSGDLKRLPRDVQKEPQNALNGGGNGLMFYEHIIAYAHNVLKPGGWLFFEIGETQGKSLENLLTRQGSFVSIMLNQDYNQRDRIIKAQLKSA